MLGRSAYTWIAVLGRAVWLAVLGRAVWLAVLAGPYKGIACCKLAAAAAAAATYRFSWPLCLKHGLRLAMKRMKKAMRTNVVKKKAMKKKVVRKKIVKKKPAAGHEEECHEGHSEVQEGDEEGEPSQSSWSGTDATASWDSLASLEAESLFNYRELGT